MFSINQLSFGYSKRELVFSNISFGFPIGSVCGLVGLSGCGKTTLLRCVAGFLAPTAGSIMMGSCEIQCLAPHRRRLSYVPQKNAVLPNISVWENIRMGIDPSVSQSEQDALIEQAAKRARVDSLLGRALSRLSGGQEKRVALARMIVSQPKLVLLDEPFASLDVPIQRKLRKEVGTVLTDIGATTLVVTHNARDLAALGTTHVGVMHEGKLLQFGVLEDVQRRPVNALVKDLLGL